LIKKMMPLSASIDEQKNVIRSVSGIKTFSALVFISEYLDVEGLTATASNAAIGIALPTPGNKNGLSGKLVREIVKNSVNNLTGPDSQYTKINVREILENMPDEEGFVSMFNGKNLDGWKGLVGNPISRANMSEKELAKQQAKADIKMLESWGVKDDKIVFSGHGSNLCSAKDYADFEMIVDWLITEKGDSGIYLRGTPQVQIWDISRVDVGAQVGSGGLYNNSKGNIKTPLKVADNPVNEWNTFRITMIGAYVTIYLNGELVVDNVRLDNYWKREIPIFETGAIELQAHGNGLAFRNIYVREINTK
jgi:hypothetical protein